MNFSCHSQFIPNFIYILIFLSMFYKKLCYFQFIFIYIYYNVYSPYGQHSNGAQLSLVIIRNHFILTEELDKVQMRGHHLTLHLLKSKNIRSLISFYIFLPMAIISKIKVYIIAYHFILLSKYFNMKSSHKFSTNFGYQKSLELNLESI